MTTNQSFADFCATADARNTIDLNIRKYALMLCNALQDDFLEVSPSWCCCWSPCSLSISL